MKRYLASIRPTGRAWQIIVYTDGLRAVHVFSGSLAFVLRGLVLGRLLGFGPPAPATTGLRACDGGIGRRAGLEFGQPRLVLVRDHGARSQVESCAPEGVDRPAME